MAGHKIENPPPVPHIEIKNPCKPWWKGSAKVEPFMPNIRRAIHRHFLPGTPGATDIHNRIYEAILEAIEATEKRCEEEFHKMIEDAIEKEKKLLKEALAERERLKASHPILKSMIEEDEKEEEARRQRREQEKEDPREKDPTEERPEDLERG